MKNFVRILAGPLQRRYVADPNMYANSGYSVPGPAPANAYGGNMATQPPVGNMYGPPGGATPPLPGGASGFAPLGGSPLGTLLDVACRDIVGSIN